MRQAACMGFWFEHSLGVNVMGPTVSPIHKINIYFVYFHALLLYVELPVRAISLPTTIQQELAEKLVTWIWLVLAQDTLKNRWTSCLVCHGANSSRVVRECDKRPSWQTIWWNDLLAGHEKHDKFNSSDKDCITESYGSQRGLFLNSCPASNDFPFTHFVAYIIYHIYIYIVFICFVNSSATFLFKFSLLTSLRYASFPTIFQIAKINMT